MTSPRSMAQATLLTDGRMLVVGGLDANSAPLASADLYDAAMNRWDAAGSMGTPRSRHVAVLLTDGRVLVAGGRLGDNSLSSAELYDPTTNSWEATGNMAKARDNFAAVRLADARVLVAGGVQASQASAGDPPVTDTTEIYDPATGRWAAAAHMLNARFGHSMTLLRDGSVLAAGGSQPGGHQVQTRTAEIYDPTAERWSATGNLNTARSFFSGTLLNDGRVLAAGGFTEPQATPTANAEIYDPTSGKWIPTASMNVARAGFGLARQSIRLADGKVFVAGDGPAAQSDTAELYDPDPGTWSQTGRLLARRKDAATAALADGRLLSVGGVQGPPPVVVLATADVYTP
jgi:hypothetical protein